jgi:glutathione S-transferase
MPKLYYTPGSCGASSFMAAKAAGLTFEAEQVDMKAHLTASGVDFYTINPKGNVPCLVLDDGIVLNENIATLLYIGSLVREDCSNATVFLSLLLYLTNSISMTLQDKNSLLYPTDDIGRARVHNELSYVATEWHKTIGLLFDPNNTTEVNEFIRGNVAKKLTYLNDVLLKDKKFLTGDNLRLPDLYLYVTLAWGPLYLGIDYSPYPVVNAYYKALAEHPAVTSAQAVMAISPTSTN